MQTLVMVRTKCCESYKCGERCSICPNRPENREAALRLKAQSPMGLNPKRTCVDVPVKAMVRPFSRIRVPEEACLQSR